MSPFPSFPNAALATYNQRQRTITGVGNTAAEAQADLEAKLNEEKNRVASHEAFVQKYYDRFTNPEEGGVLLRDRQNFWTKDYKGRTRDVLKFQLSVDWQDPPAIPLAPKQP